MIVFDGLDHRLERTERFDAAVCVLGGLVAVVSVQSVLMAPCAFSVALWPCWTAFLYEAVVAQIELTFDRPPSASPGSAKFGTSVQPHSVALP